MTFFARALNRGPFAGSRRIQFLRAAGQEEWMRVDAVDGATVHLVSVGRLPASRATMSLRALTRPYPGIDLALAGDAARSVAFWRAAADALIESQTPVRVVIAADGLAGRALLADRDPALAGVTGVTPSGARRERVTFAYREASWINHLWKHLYVEGSAQHFERRLATANQHWALPILPQHLREARRIAAADGVEELPSKLPAAWWPLVEIYAAFTLQLLTMLDYALVAHAARSDVARNATAAELLDDLGLAHGEEGLYGVFFTDTLVIAKRYGEQLDGPVKVATTHRRSRAGDRLALLEQLLSRETEGDCVLVQPAIETEPG